MVPAAGVDADLGEAEVDAARLGAYRNFARDAPSARMKGKALAVARVLGRVRSIVAKCPKMFGRFVDTSTVLLFHSHDPVKRQKKETKWDKQC